MKSSTALKALCLLLILLSLSATSCSRKRDLNGSWNGVVYLNSRDEVPIKIEMKQEGTKVFATILNGDERLEATSGSFDGQNIKLKFDYYDAEIEAGFVRREVIGKVTRTWHNTKLVRELKMWKGGAPVVIPAAAEGKDITGDWLMKVGEGENQKEWQLSVNQKNGELIGTILTPSGDWGTMTGFIGYNKIAMNRFDVINARALRAVLTEDGKMKGSVDLGQGDAPRTFTAERVYIPKDGIAFSAGNVRMKNPAEPLKFSGTDFEGKTVSYDDPRFKNKVIVIEITGSWCPNCYDEAPLLKDLYARYKAQGLEILGLSFEYTGEVKRDLEQVKIFAKKHDIPYLMLLGGSTENDDIQKKLPQLENFGAFPTTIFIGRDGLVKKFHAGFEGPATGARFTKTKADFEETVNELLKEYSGFVVPPLGGINSIITGIPPKGGTTNAARFLTIIFLQENHLHPFSQRRIIMKIFLTFILLVSMLAIFSCSRASTSLTSAVKSTDESATTSAPLGQPSGSLARDRDVMADSIEIAAKNRTSEKAQNRALNVSQNPASTEIKQPIERKIIRNGDFLIESKNLAEDQRKIAALAESLGGFVVTSEFKQSANSSTSESTVKIIVRVPASQFDKAVTEIVKTGSQLIYNKTAGQDVTEEFVDLEARLRAKHALENQYLEIMKRAAKISDVLEVQEQLTEVRTEIEQMEGRRRYLENQASLSTINVTLQSPAAVVAATQNGFWRSIKNSFGDGVDEAVGIVLGIIHFVIVALPIFVLLILPLWFILRFLNRRYNFMNRWKKEIVTATPDE